MLNRFFKRTPRHQYTQTAQDIQAEIIAGIKSIHKAFADKLVPEGTDVIQFNYKLGMNDDNAALSKAAVHQLAILAWKNHHAVGQYRRAIRELALSLNGYAQDFPNLGPFIKEWNTIYEGISEATHEADEFYEQMASELLEQYANARVGK